MAACLLLPREGCGEGTDPLYCVDHAGARDLVSAAEIALAIKAIDTAYRLVKKYNQKKGRKVKKQRTANRKGDPLGTSYWKGS